MIIIEKNVGPKIEYEVTGNKICFDDDLTINLAKRQRDDPEHIELDDFPARLSEHLSVIKRDIDRLLEKAENGACHPLSL